MNCEQELIEDATNIRRRLMAMQKMAGRSDIVTRAADLIALQDGDRFLSDLELSIGERALGNWIADTIGTPNSASDEVMPAGCKLPPLVFSPAYQFHLASNQSSSSALRHLPRTASEIEQHLHQWTGSAFYLNEVFDDVARVSIHTIAAFLSSIRRSHPELFLLLLSGEIEEALKIMPALKWPNAPGQVAHWRTEYFKGARCSIAAIFFALRVVRRALRILRKLNADHGFNLAAIKLCASQIGVARCDPAMRLLLKRSNLTVPALRKIVLMDNDRHGDASLPSHAYRFCQADTDTRTLARVRCLDGPDTGYTKIVLDDFIKQMSATLPVAGSPPEEWPESSDIDVDRVGGRGGTRYGLLANFYGLLPTDLAAHVALCVDKLFGGNAGDIALAEFANALLFASGYQGKGEVWVRPEHIRRQAKAAASTFPAEGEFGHAAGFAEGSWTDLERDTRLWIHLAKESRSSDPIGKMFVQLREHLLAHTWDVKKLDNIDDAARVVCHLAQSKGLLTGDPVWLRLQERTRMILGVTLKGKKLKTADRIPFGAGPKTLADLIAVLGDSRGTSVHGRLH